MLTQTTESTMTRLERKLIIAPGLAGFLTAWLNHTCVADPVYPLNQITSLYFDTPDLDSYFESVDGDIYKNKVRIRWYDQPPANGDTIAYVEVKSKFGPRSVKRRQKVAIPSEIIRCGEFTNIISTKDLTRILLELGYTPQKQLHPLILISYKRYRFSEPNSNMSLALDIEIASSMVARGITLYAPRLELKATILELKGNSLPLPPVLKSLQSMSSGWSAFSKYAKCLESHFEQPSSFGWLK